MSDFLSDTARIAWSGISAQSTRMRVVSENIANADSTGATPGADPYRRKTISFGAAMNEGENGAAVSISDIGQDRTPFRTEYRPGHPAADENGFVKMPNVNMLIEMADMREAIRSYTANSQIMKQVREMTSLTIDLLRGS